MLEKPRSSGYAFSFEADFSEYNVRWMDTGKIGLLVTGIAIILAIPLSVVANLLTPRLQSWYSTTSQKRAKKRLGVLEAKLQASEQEWSFTPSEWVMYKTSFFQSQSAFYGVTALFLFALTAAGLGVELTDVQLSFLRMLNVPLHKVEGLDLRPLSELPFQGAIVFSFLAYCGVTVIAFWSQRTFFKNRELHSEEGREQIRKEIRKLTLKLSAS
jgi:hypothetical protein